MARKRITSRQRAVAICAAVVTAASACGCGRHATAEASRVNPPATMPATMPSGPVFAGSAGPSTHPVSFVSTAKRVGLEYPPDWKPTPSSDYLLLLVPVGASSSNERSISLDVPDLPLHVPGMIPLGSVVNGYLDDLKKQHAGLRVEESMSCAMPATKCRRVRSTWTANGRQFIEQAQLMVHGDGVYILRANDDAATFPDTFQVYNQVADSLHFTK
jgi:hypothetical protein